MSEGSAGTGGAVARALVTLVLCGVALAGCASRGDLEQVRQETQASTQATQASIEAAKQQLAEKQKQVEASIAKDQAEFEKLAKENQDLREALARLTQALKDYLDTEQAHHEQALARIHAAQDALK